MIYNSSCYDFFINYDETIGIPIDCIWHGKLIAMTIVPFLAYQSESHSDILNFSVNYYRKIKNTENRLFEYINENNI